MIAVALVLSLTAGQLTPEQLVKVNDERSNANRQAMWVLNGWAAGNIASGLSGWISAEDPEWRAFHSMNFLFNVVNLGLGVNGLILHSTMPRDRDLAASRAASESDQIQSLINVGLGPVYFVAGAIMLWRGHASDSALLRGWGKSVLIQGAFLFIFDIALFLVNNSLGAPLRAGTDRPL